MNTEHSKCGLQLFDTAIERAPRAASAPLAGRRATGGNLLATRQPMDRRDEDDREGALYRYFAVPQAVFEELLTATSKGAYFNRHIRNHFRYQRIR
jgi:hypothetical protein